MRRGRIGLVKVIVLNIVLFLQVLLLFLFLFEDRIELPALLQAAGRIHPLILHLPIGVLVFLVVLLFFRKEFRRKSFERIVFLCLILISITASLSALFGLFLSLQEGYGAESIWQHKIGGIILSFLCYFLLIAYNSIKRIKAIFYSGVGITIAALLFTGHTGSMITHGENFVLEPLMNKQKEELSVETSSLYKFAVEPVLEKKCFSCHNEKKSKGGLVMTSVAKFKQGGEEGVEWEAGNPEASRLIQYIHLPMEDDLHMPPDGKTQLTPEEIFILEAWIQAGADFEKKLAEYSETDTIRKWVSARVNSQVKVREEKIYSFNPVSQDVIDKLNTPFRTVFPLYQNSPALQADFFVRESFQPASLEELKEIREQLVVLNLSMMPITDEQLKTIAQFVNLEKLNLNFTDVKGTGFSALKSLSKLASVSLAGTAIGNEEIHSMISAPSLRELFIWNTKISEPEAVALQNQYPKVKIVANLFNDSSTLQLSKPILVNEGILKRGELLQLKHSMPGVVIRYSLDGSLPDSSSNKIYEKPIVVNETVKLKALACKEGWYCSELLEATCYVDGYKSDAVTLLKPADKQYPGEGASSLIDGRKGFTDVLKEPSWLGFRENNFEAGFDFGIQPPAIHKIVLSYADNLGGYVFPPTEVEVWGGKNAQDLKLLKSIKVEQPLAYRPQRMEALAVSFDLVKHPYYKIIAKPVSKLPLWHGGKGQKGWFFVDEVFFY